MYKLFISFFLFTFSIFASAQSKQRATGDVNGDGIVDINDVTLLVNQILTGKFEYITLYDGYTIVVSSSNPTYGIVSGGGVVSAGEAVEISAVPKTGYKFIGWYKDEQLLSTNSTYSFIPESDMQIDGSFIEIPEYIGSDDLGHEYVDLGLSVKWATCNVGADNPEDYGKYYSWGETSAYGEAPSGYLPDFNGRKNNVYVNMKVKDNYDWTTYKYCYGGTCNTLSKYNQSSSMGLVDYKVVLESKDDAASVNWSNFWRMPTENELYELNKECYWQWVNSYNGKKVSGYIVYKAKDIADKGKKSYSAPNLVGSYSLKDPHIFLPAGGHQYGKYNFSRDKGGYYWTASLHAVSDWSDNAFVLYFDSNGIGQGSSNNRYFGFSIRPVCK